MPLAATTAMQHPWACGVFTATTAAATVFAYMDANPTLWIRHEWLQQRQQLRRWTKPDDSLPSSSSQNCFRDKRIWITGASSGIGEQLAYQIAEAAIETTPSGMTSNNPRETMDNDQQRQMKRDVPRENSNNVSPTTHIILSGRNTNNLQRVADRIDQLSNHTVPMVTTEILPFDMDCSQTELQDVVRQAGNVDMLVLNAGCGQLQTAAQTDRDETERLLRVNLLGPIHLTKTMLSCSMSMDTTDPKELRQQHDESLSSSSSLSSSPPASSPSSPLPLHITVVSSVAGKFAVPLSSSYAAAKHGLMGYFSTLQAEQPGTVRINIVCPGPVDTAFVPEQTKANVDQTIQEAQKYIGKVKNRDKQKYQPSTLSSDTSIRTTNPTDGPKRSTKMTPERCAALIRTSMVMTENDQHSQYRGGTERWIAKQPTLLFLYLHQLLPAIASWIIQKAGPLRVAMYEQGMDLYDPASMKKILSQQRGQGRKQAQRNPVVEKDTKA